MTIFDSLRYPLSIPMTDEEFCGVPNDILDEWSKQALAISKKLPYGVFMSHEERVLLLRRVIFEWQA